MDKETPKTFFTFTSGMAFALMIISIAIYLGGL